MCQGWHVAWCMHIWLSRLCDTPAAHAVMAVTAAAALVAACQPLQDAGDHTSTAAAAAAADSCEQISVPAPTLLPPLPASPSVTRPRQFKATSWSAVQVENHQGEAAAAVAVGVISGTAAVLPPAQQAVLPPAQQAVLPPAQQAVLPPAQQAVLPPAQQAVLPPAQQVSCHLLTPDR